MDQSALREHGIFESGGTHELGNEECQARPSFQGNRHEDLAGAEAELQKLFLARLDVHSRIEEIQRNRAHLRAKKVDVESKLAMLQEFHSKLLRREDELTRKLTKS